MSTVLAIETSCDETAAAVLRDGRELLASEVYSQASLHARYGGVVPEVASRNHLTALPDLVERTLRSAGVRKEGIDLVASTAGPGLPAALLVGMSYGKALAIGLGKSFAAVNHMEGHLLSPFFGRAEIPPHVGLVVSGGHTLLVDVTAAGRYEVLGSTMDDAAGEAFDKVAKLLGLGYPGGVEIERAGATGNPARHAFPRAMLNSGDFQFSFSGLKTAVRYLLEREEVSVPDVCASFQEAVIEVLVKKAIRAASSRGRDLIAVSGGVSSNRRLQDCLRQAVTEHGLQLRMAERDLRTDNAAMIAYAAAVRGAGPGDLQRDIFPSFDPHLFGKSRVAT